MICTCAMGDRTPDLVAFAQDVAALRTDDETPDGLSGDDAVSILGGLIRAARALSRPTQTQDGETGR